MPRKLKKSRRKHRALTAGEYVARATILGGRYNPYLHIIIVTTQVTNTYSQQFVTAKRYDADTMDEMSIDEADKRKHIFKPLKDEPKTGGWRKRVWDIPPNKMTVNGRLSAFAWRDEYWSGKK